MRYSEAWISRGGMEPLRERVVLGVPRARMVPDVIRLGRRRRAGSGGEGEFRRPGRRVFEVVRGVAVILNASRTESVVERAARRRELETS